MKCSKLKPGKLIAKQEKPHLQNLKHCTKISYCPIITKTENKNGNKY